MKLKLLLLASLFCCVSLVQAVTLELEVRNQCSGGFVARISCNNGDYILRGTPYAKSEFFSIGAMSPGGDCALFNLWDAIGFSLLLTDVMYVKIPKKVDQDATVKAVAIFENRGVLNVCMPKISTVIAQ